ncbi:DUF3987 domain-containing protein [Xylanibacter ruminicola]|uniref:VirE N-terminal domain-containing protein n=1 Tax=Xylanibacter ruminicola TaxID=839 RepID=A0A1M6VEI7_XYLRU|nr:DUF3987 domain-containing protein [Xylanibacter ruminicola]SHK79902.1 hypothetical protein SAMN05216463_11281 [Xylanibacter ruminicola]
MSGKIAVNSKHTGDPKKDHRGYAETMTGELLDQLLSEPWLKKMVADIRGGNERQKDNLPYICPHYSAFRNNHRAQADIIPETFTFMTCVDVDEKELVDKAIKRALELNQDECSDWKDLVLRIEYSARKKVHIYIRIPKGFTIAEAQQAFCAEIDVPYDEQCITPERFIYVTGRDEEVYRSPHWLEPLSDEEIAELREAYLQRGLDVDGRKLHGTDSLRPCHLERSREISWTSQAAKPSAPCASLSRDDNAAELATAESLAKFDLCAKEAGLDPNSMDIWGERNWHSNLLAVLSVGVGKLMSREQLFAVVGERLKNYSQTDDCRTLINYFYNNYNADKGFMNAGLREINAKAQQMQSQDQTDDDELEADQTTPGPSYSGGELCAKRLPQGIKDSVDAVGPALAMPVITAICPCIGALATGVKLDVHGQKRGLNLISYIVGEFASRKGDIDPVVDAWMSEVSAVDELYLMQEAEFRSKKKAAKNQKTQPEEPKLPVRYIALNNTVANLAERLGNVEGKHAFSFTPEADTVAQKWKSSMCDFSVMLRQSYDGSKYDREAKSADAVSVHIKHLLWNVTMCGTPDALYRVVTNYTDGFQSRIALAQTPDNTYSPLEDKPYVLTSKQTERIQQIAHLLPLINGEVVLPKLEAKGREWLEKIRLESMMNDDRVKARERFRTCVTTQRMVCCLMLCRVCEQLIQKHGFNGAEMQLKQNPNLWKEMLLKVQTPAMLDTYDVIADTLIDNALYFFRDRIENAYRSRDYAIRNERRRIGKNDTIYERLDMEFTTDMALQHSVSVNGAGVSRNQVRQMLKNWKNQGLVVQTEAGRYRKVS